ncbi:short-chain dehydrogenase/reductase 3-like [Scleropages formosus]|uniref:Short-chain dehydrogenase/reductase 3 n=1 Tax=Scleropages formosus TaxID=113540 RepID=A0A0N8K295_SCLFO|nr:short-chain dehydrogenase/reductase 3-like [Scleropages formosus]
MIAVILWGRTERCLKETCEEISLMGTECHYFVCDVGNREEVYQQAKALREKVGDVTILVNNAAVVHGKSLIDSDDDALLKSQHINTLAHFWTTKAFLPRMLELCNGHVVCINSILALSSIPGTIDYCTSKAASFAFMESLTLGLLDCPGVGCTTVLPFHTNTEMFQGMRVRFPRLFPPLKPELVAQRTVEAVQSNKAFVYLPWTMRVLVILKRNPPFLRKLHLHEHFQGADIAGYLSSPKRHLGTRETLAHLKNPCSREDVSSAGRDGEACDSKRISEKAVHISWDEFRVRLAKQCRNWNGLRDGCFAYR